MKITVKEWTGMDKLSFIWKTAVEMEILVMIMVMIYLLHSDMLFVYLRVCMFLMLQ